MTERQGFLAPEGLTHESPLKLANMAWTDDGFQTAEKSARSVFVGNIPYDTSEEQLKAS